MVSVVMPAYNAEKYIRQSIDSVLAQTYSHWELIVVDDGSLDHTSAIVEEYLLVDDRIKLYYQENGKQGKARNLGIKEANGEYIAFLDADDFWLPKKLEIQLQEIVKYKVDLVFSNSYIFFDDNIVERKKTMNTVNGIFKGKSSLEDFLYINKIPNLTVLAKKEKILSVHLFSEKPVVQNAEDYHLWLKMLMDESAFYGSDKILGAYRVHSKSVTYGDKLATKQKMEVLYDLIQDYPAFKNELEQALKRELREQARQTELNKQDYNILIERNCYYLKKKALSRLLKLFNYLFGQEFTCKLMNNTLNGKS